MPSLKDLRNRIGSVKATQKITKAMQMVAAAKLRRAQQAAESARPYADRLEKVLRNLMAGLTAVDAPPLLSGTGQDRVHLLVVCTGERGLCGAFNTSIVRLAREHISQLVSQGKTFKILCVGKKGYDQLRRQYSDAILDVIDLRAVRHIGFTEAENLTHTLLKLFDSRAFDVCTLFFSKFKSVISQIPTAQQIIPAQIEEREESPNSLDCIKAIPIYEPKPAEMLEALLPRILSVQLLRALLENGASFYGAQMSAMDNATRNAGDMIRKQTLLYNRTRQAMITKELIEIISGAEAL